MNHHCKINPCLVDTIDRLFDTRLEFPGHPNVKSTRSGDRTQLPPQRQRPVWWCHCPSRVLHFTHALVLQSWPLAPVLAARRMRGRGAVARSRTVGLRHPDYRGRTPRPPADFSSSSFLLLSESLSFFVSRFVQGFFQIANSWWRNSGPQYTPKYGCEVIYLNRTGYHYLWDYHW